jgi:hypothetical protein
MEHHSGADLTIIPDWHIAAPLTVSNPLLITCGLVSKVAPAFPLAAEKRTNKNPASIQLIQFSVGKGSTCNMVLRF